MNLHTLYASFNENITDEGIKHMNLYTLSAMYSKISDKGIKHMNLHTLVASLNKNISYEGIKHMNLYILHAPNNPNFNIKYKNIRHLYYQKLIYLLQITIIL